VIGPRVAIVAALFVGASISGSGCVRRSSGQPPHQTFDQSDEGWIPFGTDAHVEVVHDPAIVKSGGGALMLRYTVNPGQYGSAVLPLEAGELKSLQRLEFWIRTDRATPVIVVLSEKQPGGGYYSSWFWCRKDEWLHVSLTPHDFVLNQGPSDPVDADGRLDLDDVRGIGISDLGQAFQSFASDPTYPLVVDTTSGSHTILLDDVEMVTGPGAPPLGPWPDKVIGHPERGLVTWISIGGTDLAIADASSPLGQPGFSARYEQTFGHYVAISHSLLDHDLRGVAHLSLTMASQNDAKLMVYLEEKKPGTLLGPRYIHTVTVPGGSEPASIDLALAEFQTDTAGLVDPNGRLDADLLKSISLVDITAVDSRPPTPNVLWLSPITAR
jgi:hypothetical protein